MVTCNMESTFMYLSDICTWADSMLAACEDEWRTASKTPESPATDSLLTAAETERVLELDELWLRVAVNGWTRLKKRTILKNLKSIFT